MRATLDGSGAGCADTCVGLATGNLDEIIAFTKKNSF